MIALRHNPPSGTGVAKYIVATDVGGTCTDAVIFADGEPVRVGKALSTPANFAGGVMESIANAAKDAGIEVSSLLARTKLFVHGSTVVDNTVLTRSGAAVGLVATEGFEDTLLMTRGAYGRWGGLSEDGIRNPVGTDRGPPLVERASVAGVRERIDYKGAVVTPLDEAAAEAAIRTLIAKSGVEALAVCLIWSIANPEHERRIRKIARRIDPDLYVTLSSEVAPIPGEYERSSTTVINAYAGKITAGYLGTLKHLLMQAGYDGPILVMQGYGGLIPASEASDRPVGMIECGPAAGVIGSCFLGELLGDRNIIAADMGGTTFKVGVIEGGEIEYAREPMIDRYHYVAPKIHIASIGAGGGSIIWLDPRTGVPKVGPRSAGAVPGPVCYGRGGQEPTLTNVMLLIGYMEPANFLGGALRLDMERARDAFSRAIAEPLGLTVAEAAIGICRIASAQFADLIREITVERGLDTREFVMHAFGGNCPMLCSTFAADLKIGKILVPHTAPVNGAFGLVTADIAHEYTVARTLTAPFDPTEIEEIFAHMIHVARDQLAEEGFVGERTMIRRAIDLRYSRQVHEVTTALRDREPVSDATVVQLINDFEALYERRHGRGSAYREAGVEMTMFRVTARGLMSRPTLERHPLGKADPSLACTGTRPIFVDAIDGFADAPIYALTQMQPGNVVEGPAVLHSEITTIVLQDRQIGRMDEFRNMTITLA